MLIMWLKEGIYFIYYYCELGPVVSSGDIIFVDHN